MIETCLVHATAVAVGKRGVLIQGPSGSGKSDLALRLIDRGAVLVSDDQVLLRRAGSDVLLAAAPRIGGWLEVRGVGLVQTEQAGDTVLALCVELGAEAERLPRPRSRDVLGVGVAVLGLDPFRASAPIKVEWALTRPVGEPGL